MADFYESIDKSKIIVPPEYGMSLSQLCDFVGSTAKEADKIKNAFRYGYMQGLKAGKAVQ